MKRSFSLQELQNAIDEQDSAKASPIHQPMNSLGHSHQPTTFAMQLTASGSMRRSKSLGNLEGAGNMLPSISQLGLTLGHAHGIEEIKRGRGQHGKFAGSGCSSPIPGRHDPASPALGVAHDEEARGAASALMQLFNSPKPKVENPAQQRAAGAQAIPAPQPFKLTPAAGMLPPLSSILSGAPPMSLASSQHTLSAGMQQQMQPHPQQAEFLEAAQAAHTPEAKMQQLSVQDPRGGVKMQQLSAQDPSGVFASPPRQRDLAFGKAATPEQGSDAAGADAEGKHNKYCHFCQHVKVKRASSMLACVNQECARRFCEHCLVTHLNDAVPADASDWKCPICRRICCCSIQSCSRQHRHCKAFRYRQRRAEQAAKRSQGTSQARTAASSAPTPVGVAMHTTYAAQARMFPVQGAAGVPGDMQGGGLPVGGMQGAIPVGGTPAWDRGGDALGQAH